MSWRFLDSVWLEELRQASVGLQAVRGVVLPQHSVGLSCRPGNEEVFQCLYLRRLDALVCDVGVGYLTGALFGPFHQVAQLWPLSPDIRADPMAPIAPRHAAVFFTAEAIWDQ